MTSSHSRIIPVYYNFGLIFIVLTIIHFDNTNVLTKWIAGVREHSNIAKKKSVGQETRAVEKKNSKIIIQTDF